MTWFVVPTFTVFLLTFFAGSLSGMVFLTRPVVAEPTGKPFVRPAPPVSDNGPAQHTSLPPRQPLREKYKEDILPFASSRDTGKILEVVVFVSAYESPLDPGDAVSSLAVARPEPEPFPQQLGGDGSAPPAMTIKLAEPGPYPGSVLALADGGTPASGYRVKGNTRSMLYHTPTSPYFSRTKAGVWFRSAADAEQAGFTAWNRRAQLVKGSAAS